MHPTVKQFVEVLTEDVKKWEKAAEDAEKLIPHMPEPDREQWKDIVENYRKNAAEYKSIVKQYLEDNDPKRPAHKI